MIFAFFFSLLSTIADIVGGWLDFPSSSNLLQAVIPEFSVRPYTACCPKASVFLEGITLSHSQDETIMTIGWRNGHPAARVASSRSRG